MKNHMLRIILAVTIVIASSSCASTETSEFDEFRCLLTGHWDNVAQATADIDRGLDEASRHPRRSMTYVPIVNDRIAGQLFAILNYTERGFEGELSRVSLHRFRPEDRSGIVHEFMFLVDGAKWGDIATDLSPLLRLSESDVRVNNNCAMHWRKTGDHFEGATTKGQCVTNSFTEHPILVEGHGELWDERLIRHDRNFSLSGEVLPVPGGELPERFDRVSRTTYETVALQENIAFVSAARTFNCD